MGMVKDREVGPEMFLVSITKIFTSLPYVSHGRLLLITSVSLDDSPMLQMLSLSLGAIHSLFDCVVPLKWTYTPAFPAYVPKTFTEFFGIWDHCENAVFICVPVRIDVIVAL